MSAGKLYKAFSECQPRCSCCLAKVHSVYLQTINQLTSFLQEQLLPIDTFDIAEYSWVWLDLRMNEASEAHEFVAASGSTCRLHNRFNYPSAWVVPAQFLIRLHSHLARSHRLVMNLNASYEDLAMAIIYVVHPIEIAHISPLFPDPGLQILWRLFSKVDACVCESP